MTETGHRPAAPGLAASHRRVLIVASANARLGLGRTLLWRGDIERVFASDPETGFEAAGSLRPNLVVLDGANPEATVSQIRRLREDPVTRRTSIAVVCRSPTLEEEEAIRRAGASVVLSGPVDPVLWDTRLAELLNVPPRREARIPMLVEVWSAYSRGGKPVEGLTVDISVQGTLVETAEPLELGAKVDLSFELPARPVRLQAVGQVVRDAGAVEGRARSGIRFLILRGDARQRISDFVAAVARPLLGRRPPESALAAPVETAEDKEWEAELKACEARRVTILESVRDCVVTMDHEGLIVELNRAVEETFGYNRDELLQRKVAGTILAPSWRKRHRGGLARYLTMGAGQARRLEVAGMRADGSEFPMELVITPVPADGPPLFTVCLRDLTDRRQAEQSLEASARLFRALFEGAIDAMVVADDGGRYVEANPAACALYGLTKEELLGHRIDDFTKPDFDYHKAWRALQEEEAAKGEFRLVRPDGTIRDVEFTATLDFLPGSHLAVLRDITERRQLEEQYRQAQKMEAVGRLAGGVAHDFNNLLGVIYGFSELLLRTLQGEGPERQKVHEILKAAERAAALTRQLLAFSRRQVLEPRVLDLNAVVSETQMMLRHVIGEDVELRTELDPKLGRLRADPGQIEQVLMNLVVNARDAMPHGGRISIETRNIDLDETDPRLRLGDAPGRYVALKLSDTGVGMDAETQRRIFEPFFTTKGEGKGTGLGLATVYGIVEQNGGHIRVESQPGQGATFEILLPRAEGPVDSVSRGKESPPPRMGVETILLVEDEEKLRSMAQEVLETGGYRVFTAGSGDEALTISRAHAGPIHLLLTDVVMPGISGPDLAKHLGCSRPEMKVLYVSGYPDAAIVHHGVLEPGTVLLQKPFTPDALERKVREVLDPLQAPSP